MFKLMLSPTIVNSVNKNLSIKKEDSFFNISAIDIPPVLKNKNSTIKTINNKDLEEFYNRLIVLKPDYDFSYMNNNIRKIKMYPIYIRNSKLRRDATAYYDCIKNTVRYRKDMKYEVLPHELLHMSSTIKAKNNSIFSGFSQATKLGRYELIGSGLNEGYTQLLAERYFDVYKTYPMEVFIASKIEEIVTQDKMEKMYFNADLKGLTNELLKYKDQKSIIIFIYAVDLLGDLYIETDINQDFSTIKKAYFFIVNFLLDIKIKKIMETETNFQYAKRELLEYAEYFEYNIVNKNENIKIDLLNKSLQNELTNKYVEKLRKHYIFKTKQYKKAY